jgi:hypothetical protein
MVIIIVNIALVKCSLSVSIAGRFSTATIAMKAVGILSTVGNAIIADK